MKGTNTAVMGNAVASVVTGGGQGSTVTQATAPSMNLRPSQSATLTDANKVGRETFHIYGLVSFYNL